MSGMRENFKNLFQGVVGVAGAFQKDFDAAAVVLIGMA